MDIFSLVLALLIGYLLVRVLDPAPNAEPRWARAAFQAALGAGTGIGATSILFFLLTAAGVASPATIFALDFIILAVLLWRAWRTRVFRSTNSAFGPTTRFRWTWLLACSLGIAVCISFVRMVQMSAALSVGDWDAWATWNLRAKFLAGPGATWRYALPPSFSGIPAAYPLLLSGFIARLWKTGGAVSVLAPQTTALLFFCHTPGRRHQCRCTPANHRVGFVSRPCTYLYDLFVNLGPGAIRRYSACVLFRSRDLTYVPGGFACRE